tara:strand:- start:880 stop:1509 length:630 start_codon:yes stop_codon:yes gene_type:complete
MNDYIYKFNSFVANELISLKDLTILEFGVKEGRSTKIFLQHCEKNGGKLYSIDVNDYKDKFNNSNWTFIQSRDDNFDYLENKLPKKFDVIYLDSLHEADHVEKILYYYFDKLKIGGLFFIDDTSWLPYIKNSKRDNFYCEINNKETFDKLLEIYNVNFDRFDINFDFTSSGVCKIFKKSEKLAKSKKISIRTMSFKNFIRKIVKFFKKI